MNKENTLTKEGIMEHTPGPWKIRDDINIITNDGSYIGFASVRPKDGSLEKGRANARLIAAAPQLLTALQALMGTCCHLAEWERKWPNVVKTCYDAVAKATQ